MKIACVKRMLLLGLAFVMPVSISFSQNGAVEALNHDYPKIMKMYGNEMQTQKAHYIFVIDVSSSMLPYESAVKQNIEGFVEKAVSNGDQLSLIKMAGDDFTDYVGNYQCIKFDNTIRNNFLEVLYSPAFSFLHNGDLQDGSDGFTAAKKVIEAIKIPGSSDQVFVYLFTDFEYWTRRAAQNGNGYDKNFDDWNSLQNQIPSKQAVFSSGIELNTNVPLRQNAIYKSELDSVFGDIGYQSVNGAAVLSQVFDHIVAQIMEKKLMTVVQREWDSFCESISDTLVMDEYGNVSYTVDGAENPFSNEMRLDATTTNSNLTLQVPQNGTFGIPFNLGTLQSPKKVLWPSRANMGGGEIALNTHLDSELEDEIVVLQNHCENMDSIRFDYCRNKEIPNMMVWNSMLPKWVWILIGVVILIVLASIFYTMFGIKLDRSWSVSVKKVDNANISRKNSEIDTYPSSIGDGGDVALPGCGWRVILKTHKYNPLLLWKKSGYYLELERGNSVTVTELEKVLLTGDETFLASPKSDKSFEVFCEVNRIKYTISLV